VTVHESLGDRCVCGSEFCVESRWTFCRESEFCIEYKYKFTTKPRANPFRFCSDANTLLHQSSLVIIECKSNAITEFVVSVHKFVYSSEISDHRMQIKCNHGICGQCSQVCLLQ